MLMASILASMMVGGFLLTVSGDADDELSDANDVLPEDDDLYAEGTAGDGSDGLGYADILQEILNEEAQLAGVPDEALGYADLPAADAAEAGDDDWDVAPDAFEAAFEDDFDMDAFAAALDGGAYETVDDDLPAIEEDPVIISDFVPGEDILMLEYDPAEGEPLVELYGDPAGDALVYADGDLVFRVLGADGLVIPEDIQLSPMDQPVPAEA